MNATHFIKAITRAISTSLLICICALSACGKTGPLYLPDDNPSESEKAQ